MKHPTGDPNMPEAIRLAKEVHHAIQRRAHLGTAAEKFNLLSGELGRWLGPAGLQFGGMIVIL